MKFVDVKKWRENSVSNQSKEMLNCLVLCCGTEDVYVCVDSCCLFVVIVVLLLFGFVFFCSYFWRSTSVGYACLHLFITMVV